MRSTAAATRWARWAAGRTRGRPTWQGTSRRLGEQNACSLTHKHLLRSAAAFAAARGLPAGARQTGAAFARSNAALALAQAGDTAGAAAEADAVLRRFPGSADMRAAAAALAWLRGDGAAAEESWNYACDRISVGCARFRDAQWVATVRRWPPRPAAALADFLALRGAG